jgi:molybdenum cofactor cytidylyltransferase
VPAIFPRTSFSAFSELRGDSGARAILARQADRCLRIPMPNAAIDIDRPEDLLNVAKPDVEGTTPVRKG